MRGKCLCGAVTLEAINQNHVHACHCGMCRRWGGGPLLAVHCGNNVAITGENDISRYASSEWAERAFCKLCGTHLFYLLKATGNYYVPAGLFEETSEFTFSSQIFIDRKPSYYSFANETENLSEQQFYEKYS